MRGVRSLKQRLSQHPAPAAMRASLRQTSLRLGAVFVLASVLLAGESTAATAAVYTPSADRISAVVRIPTKVHAAAPGLPRTQVVSQAAAIRIARAREVRGDVLKIARKQLGDPYVAGSAGPNGFDCGGLVQYVFKKAGVKLMRSSRQQYTQVTKISRKQAQPGDLVFFFERGAHHVGIYIGNGKMIDAPGRGDRVRVSPIAGSWWGRTYTGMGRVVPRVQQVDLITAL